jgi:protein-tyrosine phosphatase
MGGVDLHCHLLPGVDDGPTTMEESLDYARRAAEVGTDVVVATPHVEQVEVDDLPDRVAELRERLEHERIPLRVECGGELKPASVPLLGDAQLDTIAHGPSGARWVLLEVPFAGFADDLHAAAAELRQRGYAVVLAHPERAADFGSGQALRRLRHELDRGAAIQMNAGPLEGLESATRAEAARKLLRLGLATAIATDAHPPTRPYTLRLARDGIVAAGGGAAEVRRLIDDGPRELLARGLRARRRTGRSA